MTVLGKAIVNVAGRPAHNVDGPSVRARWTMARKVFFSLTGHRVYLKRRLLDGSIQIRRYFSPDLPWLDC